MPQAGGPRRAGHARLSRPAERIGDLFLSVVRSGVDVSGPVNTNIGDVIGEWVLAGMGIGQATPWHAGPDIREGRLVPVLPRYRDWLEKMIWAVRPPGRLMHARVKAFLDYMRACIVETNAERFDLGIRDQFRQAG